MSRIRFALAFLAACAVAAGLWAIQLSDRATAARFDALEKKLDAWSEAQAGQGGRCTAVVDQVAVRSAVQQALEEELARLPSGAAAEKPGKEATREAKAAQVPEVTADMRAAQEEAHRLIADARGRHRWTDGDVQALRGLMARVHPGSHQEVALELVRAINNGEVRLEAVSPF